MKFLTAMAALGLALVLAASMALAQDENRFQRDTMLQSGDYDSFRVTGSGRRAAFACAQACEQDARCKAWTLIQTTGQCRLKREIGPAVTNTCCISGVKDDVGDVASSKQAFCTDYANAAADANDVNLQRRCGLGGPRWTSDFNEHYKWCMRSPRSMAEEEAQARADDIARCQVVDRRNENERCQHYVKASIIQAETASKMNCGFRTRGPLLWTTSERELQANCNRRNMPFHVEIAERERMLRDCFVQAAAAEAECRSYADKAIELYQASLENRCDFPNNARWSSGKFRHYEFCLNSSQRQRDAESQAREEELRECKRQAALRAECDTYARGAVEQARRNEALKCGLRGVRWSRYIEDHFDFCMSTRERDRKLETASREDELQACERRAAVDPICDEYAKRAVRAAMLNEDQRCGNRDRVIWNTSYDRHYAFCLQSNLEQREDAQRQRRRAIRVCSFLRSFSLEIEF